MNKVKILQVFDLDETFFRMPSYTGKLCVETDTLKFDTPYDFYDHQLSISEEAHYIQLIEPVYAAWKEGKASDSTRSILITHRIEELRETVTALLDKRGISFDEMFFLGRKSNKTTTLQEVFEKMWPEVEEIQVFEDSIEQLGKYQDFFERLNTSRYLTRPIGSVPYLNIKLYIVDKSKMYRIENFKLSESTRINLI